MPLPLQLVIVFFIGSCIGSFINWAIYRWAAHQRTISPWGPKHPDVEPRRLADRIPIFGWFLLKREESVHGKAFFARPFAIELFVGVSLALFYFWMFEGGLTGRPKAAATATEYWSWFILFSTLMVLLTIATFIDFDEKIIPDEVTVTGTIFALIFAACCPWSRLPIIMKAGLEPLQFASPRPLANWAGTSTSLLVALGCFVFWCIAFLIGGFPVRLGKYSTIRYCIPLLLQPKRKTKSEFRIRERQMPVLVKVMAAIFAIGLPAIAAAHFLLPAENWEGLLCAILGMTFGMMLVWAIRLIAGQALGTEAMGFGDVTLMAMIGAFLGWQPALLTFAFAPFAAVIIAIGQFVFTKKPDIAFGPYLSLAAIFIVVGWSGIWNKWAAQQIFVLGEILLIVIAVSLFAMFVMLSVWGKIKERTAT